MNTCVWGTSMPGGGGYGGSSFRLFLVQLAVWSRKTLHWSEAIRGPPNCCRAEGKALAICAYKENENDVEDKVVWARTGRHQHPYCTLLGGDSDCWYRTPRKGCSGIGSLDLCKAFYKAAHSSSSLRGNIAHCRFTVTSFPDSLRLVQPSLSH